MIHFSIPTSSYTTISAGKGIPVKQGELWQEVNLMQYLMKLVIPGLGEILKETCSTTLIQLPK